MKRFIADIEQTGSGFKKKDEGSLFSMLLALAKEKCFDEDGFLLKDGNVIPGTNVGKLVSYACRSEPLLNGVGDFVEILRGIGINSVPNENLMGIPRQVLRGPEQPVVQPVVQPLTPEPSPLVPPPISGESVPLPERPASVALKRKRVTKVGPKAKKPKVQKNVTWQLRQRK